MAFAAEYVKGYEVGQCGQTSSFNDCLLWKLQGGASTGKTGWRHGDKVIQVRTLLTHLLSLSVLRACPCPSLGGPQAVSSRLLVTFCFRCCPIFWSLFCQYCSAGSFLSLYQPCSGLFPFINPHLPWFSLSFNSSSPLFSLTCLF